MSLLVAGGGCAANADTSLDVTYDPCTAQLAVDGAATEDEIASLDAALALWNEPGGFALRRSDGAARKQSRS